MTQNLNSRTLKKLYLYVGLFAIAMGLLEAAVVIYLREMAFPHGFDFPLKPVGHGLALVEVSREAATIFMLIAVGYLAGHNANTRFGWFLYTFAIWDIFYYVFLKVFMDWPESAMTWDVLFLIPAMWVGPVWAPVLLSLVMIAFTIIINRINLHTNRPIRALQWLFLISGSIVCIVSFCIDYMQYVIQHTPDFKWVNMLKHQQKLSTVYVPQHFDYWIFFAGLALILIGIGQYYFQNHIPKKNILKSQLF